MIAVNYFLMFVLSISNTTNKISKNTASLRYAVASTLLTTFAAYNKSG